MLQRLFKRVGVGPGEVRSIRRLVEVRERVTKLDPKVAIVAPAEPALAALPLH